MEERDPPSANATPLHVLIVEDAPINQLVLANWLSQVGAEVFIAENLATAQHLLEELAIDIALVDYWLPDGNGTSLLPLLTNKGTTRAIAMTTIDSEDERQALLQAGFADILPKPLVEADLRRILATTSATRAPLRKPQLGAGAPIEP